MNVVKMTVNESNKKAHLESVITYDHPEVGLVTMRFDGFLPAVDEHGMPDPDSADAGDLTISISAENDPDGPYNFIIDLATGKWAEDK